MLIAGGGPAGAAGASMRRAKACRTGVVTERFGGQVLDTMGIENSSLPRNRGASFAIALERHVRDYDVDIMNLLQRGES